MLAEVTALAAQGVREVNLLGQNVNAYRGRTATGERFDLAELIRAVAQIDGIERIRFTTSHPVAFSERLIAAFADVPQLVNAVHLPVQSGSDRILTAMRRGHTAAEYCRKIEQLREVRPNISLSSDFIVGFPGETDAEFAETLALVDHLGFDQSYSFIYSRRPGTPARVRPMTYRWRRKKRDWNGCNSASRIMRNTSAAI
ncbi:radical SAM protein [Chromatium okenii]|uniref:radical SAM protein n=1 Tax=Chromatium okenii TaxID=61644 RepID=UPI003D6B0A2B